MDPLHKFWNRYRQYGLRRAVIDSIDYVWWQIWTTIYRHLRPVLPRCLSIYNGVLVRDLPPTRPTRSNLKNYLSNVYRSVVFQKPFLFREYEAALVQGIHRYVDKGDDVVIVGGGRGVTTVVAAREVGENGNVTVYEAANEKYDLTKETVHINNSDNVTINPSAVGDPINAWGSPSGQITNPAELPECDVLELDCEGSEVEILSELEIQPEAIIVETHGVSKPLDNTVVEELDRLGYSVVNSEEENIECGCYVLYAEQR